MKIGKATVPRTAICTADEHTIVVRGHDLSTELIGKVSFTDYFFLLLTGRHADAGEAAVLDATLVAIAEHGLVPSVQAARMTYAAAPDAMQGAVAAGILGCGSVVLGSLGDGGPACTRRDRRAAWQAGESIGAAALAVMRALARRRASAIPGLGIRCTRGAIRASARCSTSRAGRRRPALRGDRRGGRGRDARGARSELDAQRVGRDSRGAARRGLSASRRCKGVPILARTAGLIAHLLRGVVRADRLRAVLPGRRARCGYDGAVPCRLRRARTRMIKVLARREGHRAGHLHHRAGRRHAAGRSRRRRDQGRGARTGDPFRALPAAASTARTSRRTTATSAASRSTPSRPTTARCSMR